MEFQYHNCLYLCVPGSEITGKRKKNTQSKYSLFKLQKSQNKCFKISSSDDVIYNHDTNREEAQKGKYRNNIMFPRFSLQGPHTKFFFFATLTRNSIIC